MTGTKTSVISVEKDKPKISVAAIGAINSEPVNNGIVLVDYINVLRREHHMEKFDAIVTAGRTRLRPMTLASLAISSTVAR